VEDVVVLMILVNGQNLVVNGGFMINEELVWSDCGEERG
jgi:hypothetical protein